MSALLLSLVGCQAIKRVDQEVKSVTQKLFHRRDPERPAAKQASAKPKAKPAPAQGGAAPSPVTSAPEVAANAEDAEPSTSPAASAAAEALFEKGHEAMEARDYATACARFRESDRLEPAVGAKLNLANCEQQRGRFATSWQLFKLVADQLPAGDERLKIARSRIAELKPKIPKLTFARGEDASEDLTVSANGVTFRAASFGVPLPFDPGNHRIVVTAPGRQARTYDVELRVAESRVLTVSPGAKRD